MLKNSWEKFYTKLEPSEIVRRFVSICLRLQQEKMLQTFCYLGIMGNNEIDCSKLDVWFDYKLTKLSYVGDNTINFCKHSRYHLP